MRAQAPARLLALVAAAAVMLAACTGAGTETALESRAREHPSPTPSLPAANPINPATLGDDPIVQVVKRVAPAVVNVTSRTLTAGSLGGPQVGKGVGTGFIIRSDGIIVTNFHVVEGALSLKVTLPPPDGRTFQGRVIGGDSDHDLAVLKIEGTGLPAVPLGDSSKLALGERVIALGYALALPGGPTVTSGILSALQRTVQAQDPEANNGQGVTRTYQDVLQTDAAINPGNSGGPLVDLGGNVVGINTAGSSSAENIGFSIAINAAKPIIRTATEHPSAAAAYIGVSTETVTAGLASQLGLAVDHGALVVALAPGGPAAKQGAIQQGDVVVSFDGKAVNSSDDLGQLIMTKKPGDTVSLVVVDPNGKRVTATLTLGTRPSP